MCINIFFLNPVLHYAVLYQVFLSHCFLGDRKFQELFPSAFNAETCSIATLNGGMYMFVGDGHRS